MTRSRATAKKAGTQLETDVAGCLATWLADDRIERRAKNGAKDRGDIAGVRDSHGSRVVIECKNYGGKTDVGTWLKEAETERINDGAIVSAVVFKRRGLTDPLEQGVLMTLRDLVALLDGERP